MKRPLIMAVAGAMLCVTPVSAAIQTYSDDWITFEYDDEMIGDITRAIYDSGDISYSLSTNIMKDEAGAYGSIMIAGIGEEITEGETDDRITRIVAQDDEIIVYASMAKKAYLSITEYKDCDPEDTEKYCIPFFESVDVPDNFGTDSYTLPKESDFELKNIFLNCRYSKEAIMYAQRAVEICDLYLSFDVDGKEAGSRIKKIYNQAEELAEASDYYTDSDVMYALKFADLNFEMEDDIDIIRLKEELEAIIACGTF